MASFIAWCKIGWQEGCEIDSEWIGADICECEWIAELEKATSRNCSSACFRASRSASSCTRSFLSSIWFGVKTFNTRDLQIGGSREASGDGFKFVEGKTWDLVALFKVQCKKSTKMKTTLRIINSLGKLRLLGIVKMLWNI